MEWIAPGPPPTSPGPLPGGTGDWLPAGEGEVTAASSGPVIAEVWGRHPYPPQPPNSSQDFCPSDQQSRGLGSSDLGGAPLPKRTAAKAWGGRGMPLARPARWLSNCSDGP